ncbi:L,D-transpeptidase [Acetobacter syzygii]|uniref:L,D-transpeptidase n=1 Tax=Acetobacter syzygii TaxID=146476 RepID=UPI0039E965F6
MRMVRKLAVCSAMAGSFLAMPDALWAQGEARPGPAYTRPATQAGNHPTNVDDSALDPAFSGVNGADRVQNPSAQERVLPPVPVVSEDAARQEAWALTLAFRHEVPVALPVSAAYKAAWVALARQQLAQAGYVLDRPQVLVVVDRNPKVQRLCLILALPSDEDWQVIGSTKVSTGTTGRKYYYITPTGVFPNSAERLGYRALGTKNENGIMGNGTTGMRVWDFGWQWTEKGWLASREKAQIRLEMHATDPVYLEQRLGHTASEGCIRIPSSLNVFIDRHGLLDVEYEQWAAVDRRFAALLRKDRVASPIAGLAVVVVDTADYAMSLPAAGALKNADAQHRHATRG